MKDREILVPFKAGAQPGQSFVGKQGDTAWDAWDKAIPVLGEEAMTHIDAGKAQPRIQPSPS